MEEFYEAGTESAPRVSYTKNTEMFLISGSSDCKEPSKFYSKYAAMLCEEVRNKNNSGLHLRLSFEFISSGSLTAVEHLLNDVSKAIGSSGWNEKLTAIYLEYPEPTVEEAGARLKGLSNDWHHIVFEIEPYVED